MQSEQEEMLQQSDAFENFKTLLQAPNDPKVTDCITDIKEAYGWIHKMIFESEENQYKELIPEPNILSQNQFMVLALQSIFKYVSYEYSLSQRNWMQEQMSKIRGSRQSSPSLWMNWQVYFTMQIYRIQFHQVYHQLTLLNDVQLFFKLSFGRFFAISNIFAKYRQQRIKCAEPFIVSKYEALKRGRSFEQETQSLLCQLIEEIDERIFKDKFTKLLYEKWTDSQSFLVTLIYSNMLPRYKIDISNSQGILDERFSAIDKVITPFYAQIYHNVLILWSMTKKLRREQGLLLKVWRFKKQTFNIFLQFQKMNQFLLNIIQQEARKQQEIRSNIQKKVKKILMLRNSIDYVQQLKKLLEAQKQAIKQILFQRIVHSIQRQLENACKEIKTLIQDQTQGLFQRQKRKYNLNEKYFVTLFKKSPELWIHEILTQIGENFLQHRIPQELYQNRDWYEVMFWLIYANYLFFQSKLSDILQAVKEVAEPKLYKELEQKVKQNLNIVTLQNLIPYEMQQIEQVIINEQGISQNIKLLDQDEEQLIYKQLMNFNTLINQISPLKHLRRSIQQTVCEDYIRFRKEEKQRGVKKEYRRHY